MAEYNYKTDGESLDYEAVNDEEAIIFAKKEANLSRGQIENGAWLRVFAPSGAIIYEEGE